MFLNFLILIIGLFIGYFLGKFSQKGKITFSENYIKGINYLLNQKENEALKEFIKAVKINSENSEIYILLGNIFRKRGEIEKAIRVHQTILAQSDISKNIKIIALYNLAKDFSKAGMYKRAIEALNELEKLDKKFVLGLQEKAKINIMLKNWEHAIISYKKLSKLTNDFNFKNFSSIYVEIAKRNIKNSQYLKGKINIKKALAIYNDNSYAYAVMGDLYLKKKKFDKAKFFYLQAVEHNINSYILIRTKLNRIGVNIEDFIKKDSIVGIFFYIRELIKKREIENAIFFLEKKISLHPEVLFLQQLYFILICLKDKDYNKVKFLKKFIKLNFSCSLCNITLNKFLWQCPNCKNWLTFKIINK